MSAYFLLFPRFAESAAPATFVRHMRARIPIPANQIGSGGVTSFTANLQTASFLVNCSALLDADGAHRAQLNGGDLIFTSDESGSTRISCDIIRWTLANDPADSVVEVAVGQLALSSAVDNYVWVWWGSSTTQNQPAPADPYGQYSAYRTNWQNYWPLSEASGDTAYDRTSHQNHGTLENSPSRIPAQLGGGIRFDGTGPDRIALTPFSITGDFSFSWWQRSFIGQQRYRTQFRMGPAGYGIFIPDSFHTMYFEGAASPFFNSDIIDTTWHHIVFTRASGTLRCYIDSVVEANVTTLTNDAYLANFDYISSNRASEDSDEDHDDDRLYLYALSQADVATIYNNGRDAGAFAQADAPVILLDVRRGPWCVEAGQVWTPGAREGQVWTPGADAGQVGCEC